MYNTDIPTRAELPTSRQLARSTALAGGVAAIILAGAVLPAEYGIDPTGVGRLLGLTEMGEIKMQLAREAAEEEASSAELATTPPAPLAQEEADSTIMIQRLDRMEALIAEIEADRAEAPDPAPPATMSAVPAEPSVAAVPEESPAAAGRTDEISITLTPGEGAEVKLEMQQGAVAQFSWTANGAVVNYDTHGDGGGQSVSYEKGRGVAEDEGVLEAAFDGNHGWFWRNRTGSDVTVTLRTSGDYVAFRRLI